MVKNLPAMREIGKISWRMEWRPSPVFWPREAPWLEEPADYSPCGREELDTTERLSAQHVTMIIIVRPG